MKDLFVTDLAGLEEGRVFDGFFVLLSRQARSTRSNKPYLILTLGDRTGQIEGRIWDPEDPRIARDLRQGDIVKVRGCLSRFEERLQVRIEQLRVTQPGEASRTDMLPATSFDVSELWRELEGFVASFTDRHLRELLTRLFDDPVLAAAYREAPAARNLHHAWLGGLLEHVVSLLRLADRVVLSYPMLHRDLLLTGVILHDIGKVRELVWDAGFEYSVEGTLLGHIHMGMELVQRAMAGVPDFPPRLKTLVEHMILSHHGRLEFGSPKLPMIPEALVLNFVDDLDAKMQAVAGEFARSAQEGRAAGGLTGRVWALDQRQLLDTRGWLEER